MNIDKFNSLISLITNKVLYVKTSDIELSLNTMYQIRETLNYNNSFAFDFKAPINIDKLLSTFITQYCNKYKEQLDKFKGSKLYTLSHHHKSKSMLLKEIEGNFQKEGFLDSYCKYGMYATNYGIGIFTQYLSDENIFKIANKLSGVLKDKNIPFKNELSKKEWVYRWVININKSFHSTLIPN